MNYREPLRLYDEATGVSTSEPVALFILRSLLYPVLPVLTLMASLVLWREDFLGAYFLIAVLAFVGAGDILDVLPIDATAARSITFSSLLDVILRWLLLVAFIWALLDVVGMSGQFDPRVFVTWAICTPVALWSSQLFVPRALLHRRSDDGIRKAVVVGATDLGLTLADTLRASPLLRTEVCGFFDDRAADRLPVRSAGQVLGTLPHLGGYIARHSIDVVYIMLPMSRHPRITGMLHSLRDSTVSIYFVPDLGMCELMQPRFELVNGIPLVAVCASPFYGARGLAKRLSDVAISAALIALLSPVLLTVALGIRLGSAGPILFKQKRYGLDGKEIIVYKFRSMSVTEDGVANYTQVTRNDTRVTRFGAFIRATSLDELPQLFNVLEGSMSLVGPRPHVIAVNEQYRRLIPGYMVRHKVKPGITGWAQVNGFRGGDDIHSMRQRIALDLEYLRHWSLGLDLIIILKTALMVWKDRHAY